MASALHFETLMNTSSRRGQSLTEYILLVALLAIATVGVVLVFSDELRSAFGLADDALAGTQRGRTRQEGAEKKTLADFASAQDGDCSGGVCQF
jgi:Flp pilus assembly pilin Flp